MHDDKHKTLPDFVRLKNESGTSEDVHYAALCDYLPSQFQTIAEKELNETEEKKTKGINRLRQFLKRESIPDVDDYTLVIVLRNCKYNIKKSETKLKKYLKSRTLLVDKLADLGLKKVETILDDKGCGLLPYRDKHGRVIFYTSPCGMNLNSYSTDDVILVGAVCLLLLLRYPITTVAGAAYIGDSKCDSMSKYLAILKSIHSYAWPLLDLPLRMGRLELINEHVSTRWLYNILRPFLSSKFLGRSSVVPSCVEVSSTTIPEDIVEVEVSHISSDEVQEGYDHPSSSSAIPEDIENDMLQEKSLEREVLSHVFSDTDSEEIEAINKMILNSEFWRDMEHLFHIERPNNAVVPENAIASSTETIHDVNPGVDKDASIVREPPHRKRKRFKALRNLFKSLSCIKKSE